MVAVHVHFQERLDRSLLFRDLRRKSHQRLMVVADVIANPPNPRLIRDAEARGCSAISGRGMLVNQGVIGIKYWTGVDVDPVVMQKELARIFGA